VVCVPEPCDVLFWLPAPESEIEGAQVVVITEDMRDRLRWDACRPSFDDFSDSEGIGHIQPKTSFGHFQEL
jgi:hypothetical protein